MLLCTLVEMSVEAFEILFAGNLPTLLPDGILHGPKVKDVMIFNVVLFHWIKICFH